MPKPASTLKIAFASFAILFAVLSCGASSKTTQTELDTLLKSRLGTHYTILYNTSSTYALCHQTPSNDHKYRSFKYLILKMSDRSVVNQGSYRNGYVKWIDEKSVEVASGSTDEKLNKKVIHVEGQKS